MNHQNPLPLLQLKTTTQILHQTTTVVFSTCRHFLISLFLSILLFSYKLETQIITHYFIFNPLIKTQFAQIQPPTTTTHRHRLNDDFNSEVDQQFFENTPTKPQSNATSFTLDSYIPKLGFSKLNELSINLTKKQEKDKDLLKIDDRSKYYQHLIVWFLAIEVSAVYVLALLGFVAAYSCVHGVIFVLLVNDKLKNRKRMVKTFQKGRNLGFQRLSGFILMRWVVRFILTIILVGCSFGAINDRLAIFMILLKLIFMPFFIWFPQIEEFKKGIYGFSVWWLLLEMLMSLVFTMCACVVMADSSKEDWVVIKEGCYLVSVNIHPAIRLKCLEHIVNGSLARYILARIFGHFCASLIRSLMEAYFMVAWTTYYFSVKSMDANRKGESFGKREFKAMLRDDDT